MIKIAVYDDIISRMIDENIKKYMEYKKIEIIKKLYNSEEKLLETYTKKEYDIIFLKESLLLRDWFHIAKQIRSMDEEVKIVLCTLNDSFLNIQNSFKVNVKILKMPISYLDFRRIFSDVNNIKQRDAAERIVVHNQGGLVALQISDIKYISIVNKILYIHMVDRCLTCNYKMYIFENILSNRKFWRCHQSYLINIEYVEYISKNEVILRGDDKTKIPISKYRLNTAQKINADDVVQNILLANCWGKYDKDSNC